MQESRWRGSSLYRVLPPEGVSPGESRSSPKGLFYLFFYFFLFFDYVSWNICTKFTSPWLKPPVTALLMFCWCCFVHALCCKFNPDWQTSTGTHFALTPVHYYQSLLVMRWCLFFFFFRSYSWKAVPRLFRLYGAYCCGEAHSWWGNARCCKRQAPASPRLRGLYKGHFTRVASLVFSCTTTTRVELRLQSPSPFPEYPCLEEEEEEEEEEACNPFCYLY